MKIRDNVLFAVCIAMMISKCAQAQPSFSELNDYMGVSLGLEGGFVSHDGSVITGTDSTGSTVWRWTKATGAVEFTLPFGYERFRPTAISKDGDFIVGTAFTANSTSDGFIWELADPQTGVGTMTMISPPAGFTRTYVNGASDDGQVLVGMVRDFSQTLPDRAFRWTAVGGYQFLGTLPGATWTGANGVSSDGSVVVGISYSVTTTYGEAFRWEQSTGMVGIGDLPGGSFYSGAASVSVDGSVIVGSGRASSEINEPFRWSTSRGMQGLGLLPTANPFPSGRSIDVSADGAIVVGNSSGAEFCAGIGDRRATIWTAASGLEEVKDVLLAKGLAASLADWELLDADDISGDGNVIVGYGVFGCAVGKTWIARLGEAACYADCDKSTGNGVLDVFDFLCFQNSFVNAESYACDCDVTTGNGVCDVFDFLCFQNAFVGGCP